MDLLNKVMVVGNLTRDPEIRETASGKSVANVSLAIVRTGGGGAKTDADGGANPPEPVFLDAVLWERMAENAGQYLKKGSTVLLEGHLQMDTWQDKDSGQTRRKLKICGERMRFLNLGSGKDERAGKDAHHEEPALAAGE